MKKYDFFFEGNVNASGDIVILEKDSNSPTGVIRTDESWIVEAKWEIEQELALHEGCVWRVDVFLEQMGVGQFENRFSAQEELLTGKARYETRIEIEPRTIPAGSYKVVVTLVLNGPDGRALGLYAGFVDGPMVQIYDAV